VHIAPCEEQNLLCRVRIFGRSGFHIVVSEHLSLRTTSAAPLLLAYSPLIMDAAEQHPADSGPVSWADGNGPERSQAS